MTHSIIIYSGAAGVDSKMEQLSYLAPLQEGLGFGGGATKGGKTKLQSRLIYIKFTSVRFILSFTQKVPLSSLPTATLS